MPNKKSVPKKRYDRQRKAREIRRSLAAVTPGNSHPQTQSPLFSILPAELRSLIFEFVLSQKSDPARPVRVPLWHHPYEPLYRPGHAYRTTLDSSLLLTCRLIYYEAHVIPLRSTTHHVQNLTFMSKFDVWLYYLTKQRGAELFHLHDTGKNLRPSDFSKFLLPHLHWRKITWTLCSYLFTPVLEEQEEFHDLANTFVGLKLPASCQEVMLELETREDSLDTWPRSLELARACQHIALSRNDGTKLPFDDKNSVQYKWIGGGQPRWGRVPAESRKNKMEYHTVRLCWRANVARREYMSYDHLDCLGLEGRAEVTEILPLE